ncbi:hypothetical protein Taro_035432 [Colocasia esculenta]|uniref:Retrotransposon gag domain-containing protein n=1 Tax=Colocasia esculenta TaxID=4460 RepID=A0A843WD75_COLES|nr:hypothetical protein [Colocasia esculenta]
MTRPASLSRLPLLRSPSSVEILETQVSPKLPLPSIAPYDGTSDPASHIHGFESYMVFHEASDAAKCRVFPAMLKETARAWLQPRIVASLLSLQQKKGEALWDYVKQF